MSAPRQGCFVRADSRIGKVAFSAELAEALGDRVEVVIGMGRIALRTTDKPACGSGGQRKSNSRVCSVHAAGNQRRGIVNKALWDVLPAGERVHASGGNGVFWLEA